MLGFAAAAIIYRVVLIVVGIIAILFTCSYVIVSQMWPSQKKTYKESYRIDPLRIDEEGEARVMRAIEEDRRSSSVGYFGNWPEQQ